MKYIKSINESTKPVWEKDIIEQLKFERSDDFNEYFLELTDLNWDKLKTLTTVSGEDFKLAPDRMKYFKEDLYKIYVLNYKTNRLHSMNVFIEIMDTITEGLSRLESDGYVFKVINLELGRKKEKLFEVAIYHPDDKVEFENIFIKKNKK